MGKWIVFKEYLKGLYLKFMPGAWHVVQSVKYLYMNEELSAGPSSYAKPGTAVHFHNQWQVDPRACWSVSTIVVAGSVKDLVLELRGTVI